MTAAVQRVAVIGAGITGLSAAFRIQQQIGRSSAPLECIVLESASRLGGKICTVHHDGFLVETGPDSFYPGAGGVAELADAVGLGTEMIRGRAGRAYVYARDRLHPIPEGMVMGVPTRLVPLMRSGLLSPAGLLAVLTETLRPQAALATDESIGSFFRRRFGGELVDRLVDPLFGAIYGESVERLSVQALMSPMLAVQRRHRSLILGMRRARAEQARRAHQTSESARPAPFASFRQGMQSLVEALENRLPKASVLQGRAVTQIRLADGRYRLAVRGHDPVDADAVILATPSESAASLLDMADEFRPLHASAPASVANVVLAFPLHAVPPHARGTGFVVSRHAGRVVTACTWSHLKWPHAAPGGHALLRCHVGRPGEDDLVFANDRAITQAVRQDLKHMMAIDAPPEFELVTRWPAAMPRYAVGHLAHVAELRQRVAERYPGVWLAGAAYGGVGLGDCVRQGSEAAQAALTKLLDRP